MLCILCCGGLMLAAYQQVEAEARLRQEQAAKVAERTGSLRAAVAAHASTLGPPQPSAGPPPEPPPGSEFALVSYPAPVGELPAYLTAEVADGTIDPGEKRPAIVWITGGDSNTIGPVWGPQERENDQAASALRDAGIVMMFPSLRGGNANPGQREGFLGEVEDILAAAEYLARQPGIDADRIYLGGHSTGGTLAALVTERSDRFRATFAFGPVADIRDYGGSYIYHVPQDAADEAIVRSPGYWLNDVRTPLFLIEGELGNASSITELAEATDNPLVHTFIVPGADHFDVLAPANEAIAQEIVADDGPTCEIALSVDALAEGR
ncbi:hypothetical protein LzC2_10040 [Planctomycetes bacterium LzC2]|uniref:Peptidase S9 prolyl oligopeptidase catalytic domain-containing protein n=1 Tax=Alienimonas chondri TaxID=2681879 RepID=A0ABX1VA20_9PLAN|nr:hypothetical protein [Alienimonas chondri]